MHPIVYVAVTVIGTVIGQLMLKSGMMEVGQVPSNVRDYIPFFGRALTNLRVIVSLLLAFVASMGWIAAVSKLKLSYAYPLMASTFAFVLVFSRIIFNEEISLVRWIGVFVIWFGVFLAAKG